MSNLTLYQIADQYQDALNTLLDADLPAEAIADTLEGLQGELEVKAQNVAAFVRNIEASAEAIRAAEKQMAERRQMLERKAERIREYLLTNMQRAGIKKIESPWFVLAVRKNPVSVVIDDPAVLPRDLMVEKVTHSPDKKAIKARIEAGETIPGARL